MTILCIEDFKVEFEKLKKKNSYSSIESDIIEYFFDKDIQQLKSAQGWTTVTMKAPPKTVAM